MLYNSEALHQIDIDENTEEKLEALNQKTAEAIKAFELAIKSGKRVPTNLKIAMGKLEEIYIQVEGDYKLK